MAWHDVYYTATTLNSGSPLKTQSSLCSLLLLVEDYSLNLWLFSQHNFFALCERLKRNICCQWCPSPTVIQVPKVFEIICWPHGVLDYPIINSQESVGTFMSSIGSAFLAFFVCDPFTIPFWIHHFLYHTCYVQLWITHFEDFWVFYIFFPKKINSGHTEKAECFY